MRGQRFLGASAAAFATLLASGCGGGDTQDAGEPTETFPAEVTAASFPASQRISEPVKMKVTVRNAGRRALPNVAVSVFKSGSGTAVAAFGEMSRQPDLASTSRPVWIVQDGPGNGETAYSNTWALGRLEPGRERTFAWDVTPIVGGRWSVSYRVAAGLNGNAKAVGRGGGRAPEGVFHVRVDAAPRPATVEPDGTVVTR